MRISLKVINQENWEECIQLRPREEQSGFIASNLYSIAEAQFLPGFVTKAIYIEKIMIGFAMYGLDPDDGNYWIYRFMLDERFQKCGYGQLAMRLIIEDIRNIKDRTDIILLGYKPDNNDAKKLYKRVGFIEDGIASWGEMLAKYSLL